MVALQRATILYFINVSYIFLPSSTRKVVYIVSLILAAFFDEWWWRRKWHFSIAEMWKIIFYTIGKIANIKWVW